MKAKRIKVLNERQAIYKLSHPLKGYDHVLVSGIRDFYCHEVMIFPANEQGPLGLDELACLMKTSSHDEILFKLGYTEVLK